MLPTEPSANREYAAPKVAAVTAWAIMRWPVGGNSTSCVSGEAMVVIGVVDPARYQGLGAQKIDDERRQRGGGKGGC